MIVLARLRCRGWSAGTVAIWSHR